MKRPVICSESCHRPDHPSNRPKRGSGLPAAPFYLSLTVNFTGTGGRSSIGFPFYRNSVRRRTKGIGILNDRYFPSWQNQTPTGVKYNGIFRKDSKKTHWEDGN
jgi:hypothetical protein